MKISLDWTVPHNFEGTIEVPFPDHEQYTAVFKAWSPTVDLYQKPKYGEKVYLAKVYLPYDSLQAGMVLSLQLEIAGYTVGSDAHTGLDVTKPKQRQSVNGDDTRRVLRQSIPGFDKMTVKNPVTGDVQSLYGAIIYLNDNAGWSREQVADWLETLDLDLTIRTPEEVKEIQRKGNLKVISDAAVDAQIAKEALSKKQQEQVKALIDNIDWSKVKKAWSGALEDQKVAYDSIKTAAAEAAKKVSEMSEEIKVKQDALLEASGLKFKKIEGHSGYQIGNVWFDEAVWGVENWEHKFNADNTEATSYTPANKKDGKKILLNYEKKGTYLQSSVETPLEKLKAIEMDITVQGADEQLLALLSGGMKTKEQIQEELGLNKEGEKE